MLYGLLAAYNFKNENPLNHDKQSGLFYVIFIKENINLRLSGSYVLFNNICFFE